MNTILKTAIIGTLAVSVIASAKTKEVNKANPSNNVVIKASMKDIFSEPKPAEKVVTSEDMVTLNNTLYNAVKGMKELEQKVQKSKQVEQEYENLQVRLEKTQDALTQVQSANKKLMSMYKQAQQIQVTNKKLAAENKKMQQENEQAQKKLAKSKELNQMMIELAGVVNKD